jgi:hypothetical protein
MASFSSSEVLAEGFHPLKRTPTEPTVMANRSGADTHNRSVVVDQESGEPAQEQTLWDGSSWSRMQRSRGKLMDRANSFVGESSGPRSRSGTNADNRAVVIVDPFSTGIHLAKEVVNAGYKCARVFSIWDSPVAALVQKGIDVDFCATLQHNDTAAAETAINEVRSFFILLHKRKTQPTHYLFHPSPTPPLILDACCTACVAPGHHCSHSRCRDGRGAG